MSLMHDIAKCVQSRMSVSTVELYAEFDRFSTRQVVSAISNAACNGLIHCVGYVAIKGGGRAGVYAPGPSNRVKKPPTSELQKQQRKEARRVAHEAAYPRPPAQFWQRQVPSVFHLADFS
jgi:hypothetical protein